MPMHMTWRLVLAAASLAAIVLMAVAVTGCGGPLPDEVPGITGTVTSITAGEGPPLLATVLVEGGAQPDGAVSDKASVSVTEDTRIFDTNEDKLDVGAIVSGAQVKVWFTGPVAESYPVQGTAGTIQVVGAAL